MRDNNDVHEVLKCEIEAQACTVAVTQRAELGDSLFLQGSDDFTHKGLGDVRPVPGEPGCEIERGLARVESVLWSRVVEEIRNVDLEAIRGKVISEELSDAESELVM